ncbi:hypothetical protein KS4_26880 [Poriferisphaera corsica]|uniref:DUF3311 domain-containing protein n=1 Tax=Poriferisphaera corsica TaxID=2528020 RepID=A0A517YWP1_9BACT|nr:hypothetical protein [Poriferisphaera corsica]QDU34617.1 hypothetical protein KS4_26880 [Poriferisphaera corsica]
MNVRWAVIGYGVFLGIGLPWYWRWVGGGMDVVFGVPMWVLVSVLAATGLAGWTVWVTYTLWTNQALDDEVGESEDLRRGG